MTMKSWKPEVNVGAGRWDTNGLRFTTEADARRWVEALAQRWTSVTDYRVSPCDEPANCELDVLGTVQAILPTT